MSLKIWKYAYVVEFTFYLEQVLPIVNMSTTDYTIEFTFYLEHELPPVSVQRVTQYLDFPMKNPNSCFER